MPALPGDLARIGGLALFVLWLTCFPMSGPLLDGHGHMPWFVWAHAATLLVLARFASARVFRLALIGGVFATAFCTLAYVPLAPIAADPLLLMLGVVSAPLTVYLHMLLKTGTRPVLLAALAVGIGNLGALGLNLLPLGADIKLALLAGALPGILLIPTPQRRLTEGATAGLSRYLPFIVVYQVVSGLMYGQLWPAYGQVAALPGIELIFYAVAAVAIVPLCSRDRDFALLLGVTTAVLAFASWQLLPSPRGEHAGLFAMMIAAGITDVFLLALVLSYDNQLRAAGYGVSALTAGIAMGHWLGSQLGPATQTISLFALVVLNMAVIALVVRRAGSTTINASERPSMPAASSTLALPEAIAPLLSEKERVVLLTALQCRTYREVAEALAISESSVKTHMQRIFRKTGVFNKRQLHELVGVELKVSAAEDVTDTHLTR